MTKTDYLMKFRKHHSINTLEIVFERMLDRVSQDELISLHGAYDHRKAEIVMGKIYDKIPQSVWSFVD